MLYVGGIKKILLCKFVVYCLGGRDRYGGRCDFVFLVEVEGVFIRNLFVRMFVLYLIKEVKFCY